MRKCLIIHRGHASGLYEAMYGVHCIGGIDCDQGFYTATIHVPWCPPPLDDEIGDNWSDCMPVYRGQDVLAAKQALKDNLEVAIASNWLPQLTRG